MSQFPQILKFSWNKSESDKPAPKPKFFWNSFSFLWAGRRRGGGTSWAPGKQGSGPNRAAGKHLEAGRRPHSQRVMGVILPRLWGYLSQINRIISKTYGQHLINTQNKKFPTQRGRGVARKYPTEYSRKVGTIIIQKSLFNIIYIMRTSCKPWFYWLYC